MKNDVAIIDLKLIRRRIKDNKKNMLILLVGTFILSAFYIFSIPRTFTTDTKIVPEISSDLNKGGSLNSIASSFGIDLSEAKTSDAISPLLYPDLMKDNKFISHLFSIPVMTSDHGICCTYYDYIKKHQKKPWWSSCISFISTKSQNATTNLSKISPYQLTKEQDRIAEFIRKNINISTDIKKGVITITATDQDPLICKTLADSVRNKLQEYIILYRTNKARIDYNYYKKLAVEAKNQYVKARQLYGSFSDSNTDLILESVKAKQNDLENEMQLKYNNYSTLFAQMQKASAKIQEQTPAFSIIKGASVPILPSAPKRMVFIAVCLIFMTFVGILFCLRHEISKIFA